MQKPALYSLGAGTVLCGFGAAPIIAANFGASEPVIRALLYIAVLASPLACVALALHFVCYAFERRAAKRKPLTGLQRLAAIANESRRNREARELHYGANRIRRARGGL